MAAMQFQNPVEGPRIVPFQRDRLPADVLPNGHLGFRVTQPFASTTGYYEGQQHGALDVGNFLCGDKVFAAYPGLAQAGKDSAGALRVIIDHQNGWKSFYWHLSGWTIPLGGVWTPVRVGQQIGVVGDTGLGAVCHLHFEVHYSGVKRDPWPLLAQNQEAEVIPAGVKPLAQAVLATGNRLRKDPNTTDGSRVLGSNIGEPVKDYYVNIFGVRRGQPWKLGELAGDTYFLVQVFGEDWYVATPLLKSQLTTYGQQFLPNASAILIKRAITALEGVINALEAGLAAARAALANLKE